jgi:hypothetical protein
LYFRNSTHTFEVRTLNEDSMVNNLMFNDMPGREQVQVLHIPSLLGCTQHCRATYLKSSKSYAYTQEEKNHQAPRSAEPENSTTNKN